MPKATINSVTALTDRISLIEIAPVVGVTPDWTPGAHVDITTPEGPRSYSLIAWPGQAPTAPWRVAVQREDDGDGGSRAMHALRAGDEVEVSAPANDFELVGGDAPVTLLAGGIGITPLISMATALDAAGRHFALHYAGRSRSVMAYADTLTEIFGDRVTVHTDDDAPVDIAAVTAGARGGCLYICGPKGMIDAARSAAEAAGLAPDDIHVELFTTASPAAGDTAFEVELAASGEVVSVAADQSIIEALEAAGHDVMYDCQRGDCGICQTDVIAGTPDHRDVVLSQAEKDSGKVMQICVSRAKTPRLVLDL